VLELGKETTIVYCYLLTNKHRNSEGLYHLPIAHMIGDLGGLDLDEDDIRVALEALQDEALIYFDADVDVVFIPDALLLQPPASPKQLEGAIRKLRDVPITPLLHKLYERAFAYCKEENKAGESLPKKLIEAFPGIDEPFTQAGTLKQLFRNTSETAESESESESESGGKGRGTGTGDFSGPEDELERVNDEDQVLQSAVTLVSRELQAEEVKYGLVVMSNGECWHRSGRHCHRGQARTRVQRERTNQSHEVLGRGSHHHSLRRRRSSARQSQRKAGLRRRAPGRPWLVVLMPCSDESLRSRSRGEQCGRSR
jgi:hypothetical protein